MTTAFWRKQHKWSGICFSMFLIATCVSGILLNHRQLIDNIEIPRYLLPPFYKYENWNMGLMRGSLAAGDSVLIYGNAGIWLSDRNAKTFQSLNKGLPESAAAREVRNLVRLPSGKIMALTTKALYIFKNGEWKAVVLHFPDNERMSDMTMRDDTLLIAGRSHIYRTTEPFNNLEKITLQPSNGKNIERRSAFKYVWDFHSGEIFGLTGRLIVDSIALILIFLSVTGLFLLLLPKYLRRKQNAHIRHYGKCLKNTFTLHNSMGKWSIAFTILICLSGWMLRPPFLIGLALWKPDSITSGTKNPWEDKLRMIRYDSNHKEWLISTSEGFFSMKDLNGIPKPEWNSPPVSVMGLNVFQKNKDGHWICGSFSGQYIWDRNSGQIKDYFSGEKKTEKTGAPFGMKAVAGYSQDFKPGEITVLYDKGTAKLKQPSEHSYLPIPLWNVALETHTGRIFFGNSATYFYIFILGGASLWCLISGYKISRRLKTGKRK